MVHHGFRTSRELYQRHQKLLPRQKPDSLRKAADCDDVACFELEKPRKVEIIHDFCDPGWEQRGEYDSFWDWFMEAIEEMIHETDIAENDDQTNVEKNNA